MFHFQDYRFFSMPVWGGQIGGRGGWVGPPLFPSSTRGGREGGWRGSRRYGASEQPPSQPSALVMARSKHSNWFSISSSRHHCTRTTSGGIITTFTPFPKILRFGHHYPSTLNVCFFPPVSLAFEAPLLSIRRFRFGSGFFWHLFSLTQKSCSHGRNVACRCTII